MGPTTVVSNVLERPTEQIPLSSQDDVYLFGKFVFELITGDIYESLADIGDDFRLTDDI